MKADLRAELLIVGSGAGGSVTALELASAGREVLVLEEGGRFGLEDYGCSPPLAMKKLYRRRGMMPILGPVPMAYVEGCCVGGSTEINSGFWQRTPEEFLREWQSFYGLADAGPDDLKPHFENAEKLLKVGRFTRELPKSTQVLAKGMKALGWSGEESSRVAVDCANTNSCASGCPTGAKKGMSRSLIPLAEAKGARIKANFRVKNLLLKGTRVVGVIGEQKNEDGTKAESRIEADDVFVCAGPTETPSLLRRSGIKHNVGNTLGLHPMLKVVARFPEEINADKSVLPLYQVREFAPEITLGGAFFSLGHLALLLGDNWRETRQLMSQHQYLASYLIVVKGAGKGYVRPCPLKDQGTMIWYNLSPSDLANLSRGLARLSALLLAGGAREVYPCVYGLGPIRSKAQADQWLGKMLSRRNLSLTTVHAFATCPMGERKDLCAADSFGKVHNFENLYLNDASMLPGPLGANPQATIMALARRNALHFQETKK